jgi:hypothetical protein
LIKAKVKIFFGRKLARFEQGNISASSYHRRPHSGLFFDDVPLTHNMTSGSRHTIADSLAVVDPTVWRTLIGAIPAFDASSRASV